MADGDGRKFTNRTYMEEGSSKTYESVQGGVGHYILEDSHVSKETAYNQRDCLYSRFSNMKYKSQLVTKDVAVTVRESTV